MECFKFMEEKKKTIFYWNDYRYFLRKKNKLLFLMFIKEKLKYYI